MQLTRTKVGTGRRFLSYMGRGLGEGTLGEGTSSVDLHCTYQN